MNSSYQAGDLRVSDSEREPVLERLKDAYAEGRLDHDEFDMRMHLAMTAKTRADLAQVLGDLGGPAGMPGVQAPPVYAAPKHGVQARRGAGFEPWPGPAPTGEDRMLAALAHASGYATSFVGPLVFMLLSGKRSAFVRKNAVEALNFQLSVLLLVVATLGLGAIVYAVTWIIAGIAAVGALGGQSFRHPWILRLVR
ncbi:hypothetical protein DPM19_33145 [Actinomadura craniellae]|uniref:DUF1707 domain-containing protein n=1 Tax=Actinomadura craniellae TaxID=2231787 RepID=A0A365GVG6_9ACTN|nr:DUF1707 and DUF4870 domain-containing protein [Actinomadura craniellae]RAY10817.1 hypothetical protein DPM19_33145 [Actinomadura craniellae]